ncbi:DUF6346 domain-containing protein [Amycolatopsis sp. cmx-8-4]|uniref:DUF6346 domain-containing protein n=1 Tax=Amycolatopsis sp. cmx-8-4 TaxID=2790947 RepID=UPI00397B0A51
MTIPTVGRPQWVRSVVIAVLAVLFVVGSWTGVAWVTASHGPDRGGTPVALARVKSCERLGPISRGGIGFYWICVADVTPVGDATRSVRFSLDELTPDDFGKAVPVVGRKTDFHRDVVKWKMPSWVPALVVLLLVFLCWAERRRFRRLRRPVVHHPADVRLTEPVRVPNPPAAGSPDSGASVISPAEWSPRRYWRTAGALVAVGGVIAALALPLDDPESRRALLTLAGFGFAAPVWLICCTPRWYRKSSYSAQLTISAEGISWKRRRREEHFTLAWPDLAEVRVLTVTHDELTLRVVDLLPVDPEAPDRHPELRRFWQIGAKLGVYRLPGEPRTVRVPEAFSDAAIGQVRAAMAVFRPDLFREYAAGVAAGAPPTPITRGAT